MRKAWGALPCVELDCLLLQACNNVYRDYEPPLLIVEGERSSDLAMALILNLAESSALISSRSAIDKCFWLRLLGLGFIPPVSRKTVKTVPGFASKIRPISLYPAPCFHKSNTSFFISGESSFGTFH